MLEELEETARLWLLGERRAEPLSEAQIEALRQRLRRGLVTLARHAAICRQPQHDVRGARVPRSLRGRRARRLHGGRIPVSVRASAGASSRRACRRRVWARSSSTRRPATGPPASAAWPACPDARMNSARGVQRALDYAGVLDCPRIHLMAGLAPAGIDAGSLHADLPEQPGLGRAQAAAARRRRADRADQHARHPGLLPEPPGRSARGRRRGRRANLKVQMDLYHCQIVEGDVAMKLRSTCRPDASATCRSPACRSATSPTRAS